MRRKSHGRKHLVTPLERDFEHFAKMQDHLPARLRAPRLQERDVTRAHARFEREIELAVAPR